MSRHANTETDMRPPIDSTGASTRPFRQSLKAGSRYAFFAAIAVVMLFAAILLPSTALAIPGSGEFVALYSEGGREITELYNMIAKICLAILIIVEGALLVAIIKFRRRSDDDRPLQNHGDLRLEFAWTMGALAIQIWIGVATINVMFSTETKPDHIDMTVVAEARQWEWDFHYEFDDERGSLTHTDLVVPAHKNIQLQVTSVDVLHAIFIPDLGIKLDAVPGRYNNWWFRADGPVAQVRPEDHATVEREQWERPQTRSGAIRQGQDAAARPVTGLERRVDYLGVGRTVEEVSPYEGYNAVEYQGTCAELCGLDHWDMYFRTVVMTPSSFNRWVDDQLARVDVADGQTIYDGECAACHGADGTGVGQYPPLVGSDIVSDPDLADEHIDIVLAGVDASPPMQAFEARFNDAEVAAVINYEREEHGGEGAGIITEDDVAERREALGFEPFPATTIEPEDTDELMRVGERLYQSCITCHGADGVGPDYIPSIAGSEVVLEEEPVELIRILIEGRDLDEWPGQKRPLAQGLSDMELAALLTYLRQSFDNDAPVVQPFDVNDIRSELEQTPTE